MKGLQEMGADEWVEKGMYLLLFFMLLASIIFALFSVREVLLPHGSTDFHSYWFSGHFLRQGTDPYQAFFDRRTPSVPVHYVDGVTTEQTPVAQPGLAITPANTAPITLLLSLFSWLSWPSAKLLWLILNMVLVLLIPWLVIKLLPDGDDLPKVGKVFIFLAFFCLQGTRLSIWTGQTTLPVFALMVLTLLALDKNPVLSGTFLGVALAKYSLALPLVLFLFYKRRYAVIGVALVWQVVALLFVALVGQVSPFRIAGNYIKLFLHHAGLPGIHLASLFPESTILAATAVILLTVTVGWVLFRQYRTKMKANCALVDFYVFTILVLWTLLVAYHRAYDTAVVILFIALSIYELTHNNINSTQKKLLAAFLGIFLVILSIPSSLMGFVLPAGLMPAWYQLVSAAMTLTLLGALLISLWRLKVMGQNPSW